MLQTDRCDLWGLHKNKSWSKSTPLPTTGAVWPRVSALKELQLGAAGVVGAGENGMGLIYQLCYASQIHADNCIAY